MSESVDAILSFLGDGQWHDYSEISSALGIPEEHVTEFVRFLSRFGFVDVDHSTQSAKASEETRKFLAEVEPQPATGRVLLVHGNVESIQATTSEVRAVGEGLEVEWREPLPRDEVELRYLLQAWELLLDMDWHDFDEIVQRLHTSPEIGREILETLRRLGLVVMHERLGKAKVSYTTLKEKELR